MSKGDAVSLIGKARLEGDFFTRNPGKTLSNNVQGMLAKLAEWMEEEVRAGVASAAGSMPHGTGYTRAHVRGYTTSRKTGKQWRTWAAVGLPTDGMDRAQAIRTKAAGASIERRFHPFRRVKSGIYASRPIIQANLARGLE